MSILLNSFIGIIGAVILLSIGILLYVILYSIGDAILKKTKKETLKGFLFFAYIGTLSLIFGHIFTIFEPLQYLGYVGAGMFFAVSSICLLLYTMGIAFEFIEYALSK